MSTPHLPFYLLVTLATTIAAFGLLADSTAVVIGAMLVAPLMGPIFGIAFGLTTGDTDLLGRSIGAEVKGMALAVAIGFVIGSLVPHIGFGGELLARTRPTVYDIVVAVASGIAGAFALADRRVGVALPGVAIATAIVPPLATVGLCLAARRPDLAGGAFLLFAANLLAIEIAAVSWFTGVGMRQGHLHEHFRLGPFLRHFGVSLALLLAIGTFMTRTLLRGIRDERQRDRASRVIGDEVRITAGARLTELTTEPRGDSVDVLAVVLTPQEFTPEQVARLEARLNAALDEPARLVVRSIISRDASARGPVYVADEEIARRTDAEHQTAFLTRAADALRGHFATLPGVELEELRRERDGGINRVTAVVRTPVALAPPQVDSLAALLQVVLGERVRLTVRSVLTRDADQSRFLYDPLPADSLGAPQSGRAARTGG